MAGPVDGRSDAVTRDDERPSQETGNPGGQWFKEGKILVVGVGGVVGGGGALPCCAEMKAAYILARVGGSIESSTGLL